VSRADGQQNNFNGGELSPLVYGRVDLEKYQNGLKLCNNFVPLVQGPVERRPGTKHVAEVKTSAAKTRVVPFQFSTEQAYILEFGNTYVRFYKDRGQILSGGSPVELTTTYVTADLFDLKFTQSADVLYITHPSYPPRKLERLSDTSWTITNITFLDGPYLLTNATATTLGLSGTSGSVTVTASATTGINNDTGFQTTDVGRLIRWEDAAGNWTWLTITAHTSTTVVTATIDGPNASATTATTDWRLGVWSATTGYPTAVSFHQDRLFFAGPTDNPQRLDGSVTADFENFAPTDPDGTVLDDGAVTRTLSSDQVNAIRWLADDEKGLLVGTSGGEWVERPNDNGGRLTPTNIDAARSSTFGSANIQPVRVGKSVLFTQKARRKVRELAYVFEDDGFRAPDTTLISEHITRTGITQMAYALEPQPIVWMTLVDGKLIGLTYDRDQQVLGYHRHILGGASDAFGADAKVESIAVIPAPDGASDELYMTVQRYINGGVKRYVEYLTPFWEDSNEQEDAFFVDSGLTLDEPLTVTAVTRATPGVVTTSTSHGFSNGDIVRFNGVGGMAELNGKNYKVANVTATTFELTDRSDADIDTSGFGAFTSGGEVRKRVTTVGGLSHLEGETVSILAEGAAHPDQVVSSGGVTLDREASRVQAGLAYRSDLQTLRYNIGARTGTAQGKKQRIHRVYVRVFDTLGGKFGSDADSLDVRVYREGGDAMDTAVALFTGDLEIQWDGDYSTEALVYVRQDQPLPMTVQAIFPQLVTEDRQ
jgi:hypothetical protein